MGSTGLLDVFLELYDDFVATPFPLSSEGETGAGGHETAVVSYFHGHGFSPLEKRVTIPPIGRQVKPRYEYIMNRSTHRPTADIKIQVADGLYTILQPYSSGRGSFNPAPDLYLIEIKNKKVINWLGIECKSSKGAMKPTWNDNLPRPYTKGNIVYFLTGEEKYGGAAGGAGEGPSRRNMLFTAEAFFGKTEEEIEEIPERILSMYTETRAFIDSQAKTHLPDLYERLKFGLRQKAEQKTSFVEEEIVGFTELTKSFLKGHRDRIAVVGAGASPAKEDLKVVAAAGAELSSNSSGNEREKPVTRKKKPASTVGAAAGAPINAGNVLSKIFANLNLSNMQTKNVGKNSGVAGAARPARAAAVAAKSAIKHVFRERTHRKSKKALSKFGTGTLTKSANRKVTKKKHTNSNSNSNSNNEANNTNE